MNSRTSQLLNVRILAAILTAGICTSCVSDDSTTPAPAAPKPVPAAQKPTAPAPAPAAPAAQAGKPAKVEDFPADVRKLLRELIEKDALAALKESGIPANEAIVVRPFLDDRNGYVRNLLKIAVTDSGHTCVEASDDQWETIMKEIGWNQGFADILEPRTMTVLGKLLPTRILVYGTLRVSESAKGRAEAELTLHACDLETRRHIWGKTLRAPNGDRGGDLGKLAYKAFIKESDCGASDLSVFLAARPADKASELLAEELLSVARENVGGRGFQITKTQDIADTSILLDVTQAAFDRTGESVVMDGSVRVIATVPARRDFYLAETSIDRVRGQRQLGDRDATLSVRDAIKPKLVSWLGENVTVEKTGMEACRLVYDISRLSHKETAKFISDYCHSIGSIPGVCACRLQEQSDDEASFYVSFLPKTIPEGVINAGRVRFPALFATVDPAAR